AADRDERGDALGPQCRDDAGGAAAPIIAGECRAFDPERVEKIQEVMAECGLLAGSRRLWVEKPGRPAATQIGHEHMPTRGGERTTGSPLRRHVFDPPRTSAMRAVVISARSIAASRATVSSSAKSAMRGAASTTGGSRSRRARLAQTTPVGWEAR